MRIALVIAASVVLGVVLALGMLAARNAYRRRKKATARRAAPRGPSQWPKI